MTNGETPVEIPRPLTHRYGDVAALRDVSLTLSPGTVLGVFGPNGAGKTTLMRILSGQLAPTEGAVRVLGVDPVADPIEAKRRTAYVPEAESPPSFLTAREYLEFVLDVRDARGDPDRWIAFFDLDDGKRSVIKDLSKGNRQKVMLAGAFIANPPLLLLDEPFINLDPLFQRKVQDWLVSYVGNGGTILLSSHILTLAERLCDRAILLDRGRIIHETTMEALRESGESLETLFLARVQGESTSR